MEKLERHYVGKRLLRSEFTVNDDVFNTWLQSGELTSEPAMSKRQQSWCCHRCGNEEVRLFATFPCAVCNKECVYCRHCIMLGKVTACSSLYFSTKRYSLQETNEHLLEWDGQLTKAQQRAAERLSSAVGTNKELLIWGVCGSGKSEILFSGLEKSLQKGERVLLATPRTDVVLELTPRLKAVFPTVEIVSLYGGSADSSRFGQLVIATTHQVLRFYRAFDLVIIDEIDAFPYNYDPSLAYAISKAKKETSTVVYLTATPTATLKKASKLGQLETVKISRRFHGHPLPVPRLEWCGNWQKQLKKNRLPKKLADWLAKQQQLNKPSLIFVPSIPVLENLTSLLEASYRSVSSVHASDPDRKEKVQAFRDKQFSMLVTTTILERGVTIENVAVTVLGAEQPIFTESALIQIAGRAGRSPSYPDGDVVFFHYGKTNAMNDAIKEITMRNEEKLDE